MKWWYCLKHNRVEGEDSKCAHSEALGPYKTEDEAAHALELAHKRNEQWDAGDNEWEGRSNPMGKDVT